jgi:hypothetical protein
MTSHSLRQLLKSLGWSGTYSPHATRTTGYNHATYLDERKVMMQEWADKLDGWISNTRSNADVS